MSAQQKKRGPPEEPPAPNALSASTTQLGDPSSAIRGLFDRAVDLTSVWGPYTTFVAILTVIGLLFLHLGRADTTIAMCVLVIAGMLAPLMARFTPAP